MSADQSPEFAGFEATPSSDVEQADDVRSADAESEENTSAEESRDPDHGYDPMSESGSENAPEDEVGAREDEEGLLPPGSTADGAGTSLGAVPAESAAPYDRGRATRWGGAGERRARRPGSTPVARRRSGVWHRSVPDARHDGRADGESHVVVLEPHARGPLDRGRATRAGRGRR
ncbi:hypothetical protein [Rathayibacter iranicus]|uniref:hypothetical protein n=1 Tax=Rathayibacter iranicus TaxID=59737 RepID=UPI0015E2CF14|nr:hypothetical protein [Rathayibacter iranicus]